ncbi:Delta(12) fatty acid desaturase [Mycena kentingensis (nom. inval.)]|nr:Delta(12) fatty acid desaturase [Mycena kentingensis (nom. inval.)]
MRSSCSPCWSPSPAASPQLTYARSMKDIRAAIPAECFVRDTSRGLGYVARDIALAASAFAFALAIEPSVGYLCGLDTWAAFALRWAAWSIYWWFQALIFTGMWVLGHECGHGAVTSHKRVNDTLGFILHSALLTPYFSWKISHHRHHMYHGSISRDETFIPWTRSEVGLPAAADAHDHDYDDIFGDTPLYTLLLLVRQQLFGFPAYFLFNASGARSYPKGTNHFSPSSPLFTPNQRNAVILSNLGLGVAFYLLSCAWSRFGAAAVFKFYLIPWLGVTNWFVMITYLQHTSPDTPRYRDSAWTYQRGALATVDRPNFLGWHGRFFLHNIVQYHAIHHFFPKIPFYNCPEATKHLKALLGDHYLSSEQPAFEALWEVSNKCLFVEDEGDVVFYKDKRGNASHQDITVNEKSPVRRM